jgi:hypothetical protein
MTSGKREAAEAINAYFMSKVDILRAASMSSLSDVVHLAMDTPDSAVDAADKATDVPDPARESAKKTFVFTFATAAKIAKIVRGLKAT